MAILVNFSAGETSVKTSSLHQWDYGQQLEIHSYDLPSLIEVHFACQGMNEAVVHSCSVENGVAMVDIPNRCLEQTNPITAWVYEIDGTKGTTTKTITIPIIARIRPGKSAEIPQDVSDQYTDLITEVNEAIESLKSGKVVIDHATHATSADTATTAGNAASATHATSAENAQRAEYAKRADSASEAICDHFGDIISAKYASFTKDFELYGNDTILIDGTFQIKVCMVSSSPDEAIIHYLYGIITHVYGESSVTSLGLVPTGSQVYSVYCSPNGRLSVHPSGESDIVTVARIYYRRIG